MAQKDLCEKLLEDYNDVFSDIFNVLLFKKNMIQEDLLLAGPTESIYKADQGYFRKQRRDIFKYYANKTPVLICSLGVENFSFDIAFLDDEVINSFTSDFKLIARFFKSRRLGNKDFLTYEKIHHLGEFLDLISVFTNDKQYRKIKKELLELQEKGRDVTMCYIVEEFMEKGRNEGRQEGLKLGRKQGRKEGWKLGRSEGLKLGRSEGRNLGRQESRLEVLHSMFSEGLSVATIKKLGFTDDEIQTAQNSLIISKPGK